MKVWMEASQIVKQPKQGTLGGSRAKVGLQRHLSSPRNGPASIPNSLVWLEVALGKHGLRATTEVDFRAQRLDPWLVICPTVGGLWGTSESHHWQKIVQKNYHYLLFRLLQFEKMLHNLKRIYYFLIVICKVGQIFERVIQ